LAHVQELLSQGAADDAERTCDEIIATYRASESGATRVVVAQALFGKSEAFSLKGLTARKLEMLDEVIAYCASETGPNFSVWAARAHFNKAGVFLSQGWLDDCIQESHRMRRIFQQEVRIAALFPVADLLLMTGRRLLSTGRPEDALTFFDAIRERFDKTSSPGARKRLVHATFWAAMALGRLGRFEDSVRVNEAVMNMGEPAVAALDELSSTFAGSEKRADREMVAWTLLVRGGTEAALNQRAKSSATMAEIVERFQEDPSPLVQTFVSAARQRLRQD
jgi:hypothetical protein